VQLTTLDALRSPAGEAALLEAATLAPDEAAYLKAHERLRKRYPADLAQAAIETVLLRRKAARKFAHPEGMFFTRDALEQATTEPLARYRAARFAGLGVVADLCCGIGGDALALARVAHVIAVDRDPTIRARHDEIALRRLLRDAAVLIDRVVDVMADGDLERARVFAEAVPPMYRRRKVPMDDLINLSESIRTAVGAILPLADMSPVDATVDVMIERFRWNRRIAGDARKRNRLLQAIYKGA